MAVTFLADACALLAFLGAGASSTTMREGMRIMLSQPVSLSPITVWEITRKAAIGKLPELSAGQLVRTCREQGFDPEPLTWEDAEAANLLPMHHKDPMDRMLIAVALRRGMTVITDDRIFPRYGVVTVW